MNGQMVTSVPFRAGSRATCNGRRKPSSCFFFDICSTHALNLWYGHGLVADSGPSADKTNPVDLFLFQVLLFLRGVLERGEIPMPMFDDPRSISRSIYIAVEYHLPRPTCAVGKEESAQAKKEPYLALTMCEQGQYE